MKKFFAVGLSLAVLCVIGAEAAKLHKKKLQIFILAGQSNMVGHAGLITVPALLTEEGPGAEELAKLIFKEGAIAPGDVKDYLQTRQKCGRLANEIRTNKTAEAEAELKQFEMERDAKLAKIKNSFKVSKRVYVTGFADRALPSGPLTCGFGAGDGSIGPELGFGLSLEQKLDAPILLIKTSWGGKSLHYDFRPPSAGPYELSDAQKKLGTEEYLQALAKARNEDVNVWLPKAKKAIAAFWVEHDKFMAKHLSKEKYAEWQKLAADWHKACDEEDNGGPDRIEPWKVWGLERRAQAFFDGTDITAPTMDFEKTLWKERPALADGKTAQEIEDTAGLNYRMMNETVRAVLKDLKKYYPEYDPAVGYEIAGFVWFQGFNDQFGPAFHENYKDNMIALIKDVRNEYNVPRMPFVNGVFSAWGGSNVIAVAQREATAEPQFKGNVASVEVMPFYPNDARKMWDEGTWGKNWVEFGQIASDKPYHYMGSGMFFVRLGDAMASAMADLMEKQK